MCEGIWEDGRSSLQGALIKGKEPQHGGLRLRACASSHITLDQRQAGPCFFGPQFPCLGNEE